MRINEEEHFFSRQQNLVPFLSFMFYFKERQASNMQLLKCIKLNQE